MTASGDSSFQTQVCLTSDTGFWKVSGKTRATEGYTSSAKGGTAQQNVQGRKDHAPVGSGELLLCKHEKNFFLFIYLFLFVVNFVIHWNETAMGLHVFHITIPTPTSLSTRSL